MSMVWFLPVGVMIGVAGTQTALRARHISSGKARDRTWWLLLILAWLPSFCWILAQFIDQY
jgi:hypothetical protein